MYNFFKSLLHVSFTAQKSRGRRKRKLDNDQKIKTEVSKADSEEELKKLTKTAKRVRRK